MNLDVSLDYALTLLAALLIGTGFVLQQQQAQREPDSVFLSLRLIVDLLHAPRWLVGIGFMIGGQVLAAWSIGHLSLAFVEPLLTTNLVFALLVAVPLAKASLRVWEIGGAVVLCGGVGLLSASRSAKPIGLSFGSFSHWWVAAVIAGLAFIAVHQGRLHPGRTRAMLTGTGAGLVFGIQDALTRQTLEILQDHGISALFFNWAPYALVGAGATGIWLMQSAFNAGPLPLSLPAISAGEPLVGIALGIVVFGDRVQVSPGELAIEAGGIVALVVGVILVGRAPALSGLRSWAPPGIPHPHVTVPHVTVPPTPTPTPTPSTPPPPQQQEADRAACDDQPALPAELLEDTHPDLRGLGAVRRGHYRGRDPGPHGGLGREPPDRERRAGNSERVRRPAGPGGERHGPGGQRRQQQPGLTRTADRRRPAAGQQHPHSVGVGRRGPGELAGRDDRAGHRQRLRHLPAGDRRLR